MLRLTRPSLHLPLLTLLFLLILIGMAEAVVRQPAFQSRLMAPTLNTRHRQFEVQWHRLQQLAEEDGRVDCIVLGNSMVVSGFDPLVFAQSYQEETGETLTCFNFGVDAIPTMTAGALAKILIAEYQPRLFIYGLDARDLAVTRTDRDTTVILDMPWLQYRLGRFNVEGWLVEHSAFYRYRRLLYRLTHFQFRDTLRNFYGPETPFGRLGYDPVDTVADYVIVPPDPNMPTFEIQYYYKLLSDYQMQSENQAALELLLAQQQRPGQLLIIEMPVPNSYFYFFGDATADHADFTRYVDETAARYDVPFWETSYLHLFPDDSWMDYSHLNAKGAAIFSDWLGRQIAQAVKDGVLLHGEQGQ